MRRTKLALWFALGCTLFLGAGCDASEGSADGAPAPVDVIARRDSGPAPRKDLGSWPDLGPAPDAADPGVDAGGWWVGFDGGARDDVPGAEPPAAIIVDEGDEVIPQTNLHLSPNPNRFAPERAVRWRWRVAQPVGSQSVFVPSPTVPTPTFEANVAGVYEFFLDAWDDAGEPVATTASFFVSVIPDEAIHIELLWDTPGDPDQTDTGPFAGSDMDLHFVHARAPSAPDARDLDGDGRGDPYFDQPWDCYWFNPHPDWGEFGSARDDDPGLDRDDTDGAGPENINLNVAEDGIVYQVAVHYWDDHSHGASFATVRVYLYGALAYEVADFWLVNRDLWCVAYVLWPAGVVEPCARDDGNPRVTPHYQHPMFFD